jgi:hypothetical protein
VHKMPLLTSVVALTLLAAMVGCSRQTPTPLQSSSKFKMQYELVAIVKDEKGEVKEIGNRTPRSAIGGEVIFLGDKFQQKSLDVIEVGATRARFRIITPARMNLTTIPGTAHESS